MDREIDIEIDAIGLKCPLPVLRLQKRLAALAPGQVARLRASDPMAQSTCRISAPRPAIPSST
jgi:TusA-related sulfurtransferase